MLKIELQIKKGTEKLKEIKEELISNSDKLNNLVEKRASLLADLAIEKDSKKERRVEQYTQEIGELRSKTKDTPELVIALEKKLKELLSEKEKILLEEKISKQKETGSELCSVSKKFIESLNATIKLNSKLRELWQSWNSQKEETKFSELPGRVSLPSVDMLNYLNILISEYEGKAIRKREFFSRIQL